MARLSTAIGVLAVAVLALVALPTAASKGVKRASSARIAFIEGRNGVLYTVMPDGTGKRRVTPRRRPHDSVDDLEWSPDGRKLVYVWNDRGYPRPHPGYADLFVINASGGKPRPVAKTAWDEINPTWSPNGKKIAYDQYYDGYWSVWVVNANGTRPRRLTPGIDLHGPAWSADGRKLACSDRAGRVYTMNADGTGRRRLTSDEAVGGAAMAWSPRGRRLVFQSGYDLWLVDRPGGKPRQLFKSTGRTRDLSWSPDGRLIAFTQAAAGDGEIFVVDVDAGKASQLTDNKVVDEEPSWSPDSREIAFTRGNYYENQQIYVMNVDGSNQRTISTSPSHTNHRPRWATRLGLPASSAIEERR